MLTAIIIILYAATVTFDYVPRAKERPKKDNIVYWAVLAVGFIVLFLFTLDIRMPGPDEGIRAVVEGIFGPVR